MRQDSSTSVHHKKATRHTMMEMLESSKSGLESTCTLFDFLSSLHIDRKTVKSYCDIMIHNGFDDVQSIDDAEETYLGWVSNWTM